jgi:hypothetical protein
MRFSSSSFLWASSAKSRYFSRFFATSSALDLLQLSMFNLTFLYFSLRRSSMSRRFRLKSS